MPSDFTNSNFRTRCIDGRRHKGNPIDELQDSGRYECFGQTRPYGLVPVGEQSQRQTSQFWQVTPPAVLLGVAAIIAFLTYYGYILAQHINFS